MNEWTDEGTDAHHDEQPLMEASPFSISDGETED